MSRTPLVTSPPNVDNNPYKGTTGVVLRIVNLVVYLGLTAAGVYLAHDSVDELTVECDGREAEFGAREWVFGGCTVVIAAWFSVLIMALVQPHPHAATFGGVVGWILRWMIRPAVVTVLGVYISFFVTFVTPCCNQFLEDNASALPWLRGAGLVVGVLSMVVIFSALSVTTGNDTVIKFIASQVEINQPAKQLHDEDVPPALMCNWALGVTSLGNLLKSALGEMFGHMFTSTVSRKEAMVRDMDAGLQEPRLRSNAKELMHATQEQLLAETLPMIPLGPRKGAGGEAQETVVWWIADTGDGYTSTLKVAREVSARMGLNRKEDHLLIGGDLAYPYPSREAYLHRLVRPFEDAFWDYHTPAHKQLVNTLTIVGNHDTHDLCKTFGHYLDEGRRHGMAEKLDTTILRHSALHCPAIIKTEQLANHFLACVGGEESPVAVICGLDGAIDGEISVEQANYFIGALSKWENIADQPMVVITIHQPYWLIDSDVPRPNLERFMRHMLEEHNVGLVIAGDVHSTRLSQFTYTRQQDKKKLSVPFVVNGGGGAFMHRPHRFQLKNDMYSDLPAAFKTPNNNYRKPVHMWPSESDSRGWLNWTHFCGHGHRTVCGSLCGGSPRCCCTARGKSCVPGYLLGWPWAWLVWVCLTFAFSSSFQLAAGLCGAFPIIFGPWTVDMLAECQDSNRTVNDFIDGAAKCQKWKSFARMRFDDEKLTLTTYVETSEAHFEELQDIVCEYKTNRGTPRAPAPPTVPGAGEGESKGNE